MKLVYNTLKIYKNIHPNIVIVFTEHDSHILTNFFNFKIYLTELNHTQFTFSCFDELIKHQRLLSWLITIKVFIISTYPNITKLMKQGLIHRKFFTFSFKITILYTYAVSYSYLYYMLWLYAYCNSLYFSFC